MTSLKFKEFLTFQLAASSVRPFAKFYLIWARHLCWWRLKPAGALSRIPARGALQVAQRWRADLASSGLQQVLVSPYHGVSSQELLQVHYQQQNDVHGREQRKNLSF